MEKAGFFGAGWTGRILCPNISAALAHVEKFLFTSSSWLTPVHEKDLVLCLLLDVMMRSSAAVRLP